MDKLFNGIWAGHHYDSGNGIPGAACPVKK
jgi:hypothetical protein